MQSKHRFERRCFRYLTLKSENDVISVLELIRPRRWSVTMKDGRYVVFMETMRKEIVSV